MGSKCNLVGYAIDGLQGDFKWSGNADPPKAYFVDCAIGEIKKPSSSRRGITKFASIAGHNGI